MVRWAFILMSGFTLLWFGAVAGAEQYPDLTAPEVKMMVEDHGALLVHVLSRLEYNIQHIPDSINIPITEVATTDLLPADRDRPIIFYCMGVR